MSNDFDLLLKSDQEKFIDEVVFQIEKDFGMAGFQFEKAPYLHLEDLIDELKLKIESIKTEQPSLWMKIVYRVDLTEKQYRFVQVMGSSTPENMAKAVILREFQKVANRKNYGN